MSQPTPDRTAAFPTDGLGPPPPDAPRHDPDNGASSPIRYQFLGEIARGGMGVVLKGRDTDLGRDVAVKVLLEQHAGRSELLQRFLEEAQIAGQLQHPGIVPVYDLGQLQGRPFFSMKLVKGQTLARLLADRGAATQERPRLLQVFEAVCQAVAYAHAHGVLHRDLKPANVMVGGFGEVLVMDWGLAKLLRPHPPPLSHQGERGEPETVVRLPSPPASGGRGGAGEGGAGAEAATAHEHTQAGSVLGTPPYMAPEQARGDIDLVDERADVFGLGAILCEILTGLPPFTGTNPEALRKSQIGSLDEAYDCLRSSEADEELIDLATRCLAREPWQRPRNASVVAERGPEPGRNASASA
jgi:serine/threonine protein kinase